MSSPAKRRKKNTLESLPSTIRSLDYFFGKQIKDNALKLPGAAAPAHLSVGNGFQTLNGVRNETVSMTDEDLAKKLQQQWDDELVSTNGKIATQSSTGYKDEPAKDFQTGETSKQHKIVAEEEPVESRAVDSTKEAILSLQSAASAEDTISSTIPFEENPLTFDPSNFVPGLKAYWANEGGEASYALLTRCFVLVNSTQSRIKIVDTLVNMLRVIIEGDPGSLLPTVSSTKGLAIRSSLA